MPTYFAEQAIAGLAWFFNIYPALMYAKRPDMMEIDEPILQTTDTEMFKTLPSIPLDLIKYLPVAVYTCDVDGYITQYNDAAVELWGRSPEIGKDMWCGSWKIYYPNGVPMKLEECPMAIALKTRKPVLNEQILLERPDGQRIIVAPHPAPIFDTEGKFAGCVNMLLDITERKRNEANAARLSALVASSDDAIIGKTLEGIVTSWNGGAERIFGYKPEEIIGQSILTLIPDDRKDEEPVILSRLRRGERIEHFETVRVTKDGRRLDISLTISPVKDKDGNVIGVSKIARDITAQKQAERLIKESEERFKMAIAATAIGTWDYNVTTGELMWSEECRKIYDIPDDVPIDFELFSKLVHPKDAEFVLEHINKVLDPDSGDMYDIEFRIVRYSDNKIRWIRSQGKVYFNGRQPERFIGTVLDVTDEKAIKQTLERTVQERTRDLEKANKALERSNGELEEFAYVASHDLQEPLRKIKVFADRVLMKGRDIFSEDIYADLNKIISSSDKMSMLIKDLLNYATIQPADLRFVKTDLNSILQSVIDDLDITITNKKALINKAILPEVEAIPLQMNQLFYNLLNNSLKFITSERQPMVTITCEMLSAEEVNELQLNEDTVYWKLQFCDNGIGFGEAHSRRIFTIFQRLNNRDQYPGTGIGLALCKKVVDNHHGVIFAEGEENVGAKFTVILPENQY